MRAYASEAFARRDRVSEREKLAIASRYYHAHGPFEQFKDTLELRTRTFPRDWYGFHMLAETYAAMGQYAKAVELAREEVRLNPDSAFSRARARRQSDFPEPLRRGAGSGRSELVPVARRGRLALGCCSISRSSRGIERP